MKYLLVTNNKKVYNFYKETNEVLYLCEGDFLDVISLVKGKIDLGHVLLTDPIISNIADRKNPYKTIAVSDRVVDKNEKSTRYMEEALSLGKKIRDYEEGNVLTDEKLKEFRYVDLNLINESLKFV